MAGVSLFLKYGGICLTTFLSFNIEFISIKSIPLFRKAILRKYRLTSSGLCIRGCKHYWKTII